MLRILAKAAAVFVGGTFVISAIGAQVVRQNVTKNSVLALSLVTMTPCNYNFLTLINAMAVHIFFC